jgi:small conductance mechanosensitive channel
VSLAQEIVPLSRLWWEENGWALAISLLFAVALTIVSRRWLVRYRRRAKNAGDDREGRRRRRVATVVGLISGVTVAIAWSVFVLTLLKALGVDLAPILASVGILGIALGFGAQTLVRDTLSGLFIFIEGQYDVGDVVDLQASGGTVSGTVEALGLRTTSVRQYDGTLSVIPNGTIEITNNRTRGWGRAVVDVRVALTEDADQVRAVIDELFGEIQDSEPLKDWLRGAPQVLGVTQLTDVAQVIRVVAETVPSHRVDTERYLRERVVARIAERGVKVPPVAAVPQRPQGP